MTELKTLQYPRHVHRGAEWKVVQDAAECDAALDAGWVLSPGDSPRAEQMIEDADHETGETPEAVADVPEPDAPVKHRGRPKKASK